MTRVATVGLGHFGARAQDSVLEFFLRVPQRDVPAGPVPTLYVLSSCRLLPWTPASQKLVELPAACAMDPKVRRFWRWAEG